ncbi:DUF1592 domain-containing protein [Synoicihabitans lomoniglobus]|uniref:DUF1592 domain-containing protein n=1 Tax=Synoicihabitans lomoniglobus TaxID=2909285 RepID=A0AAF0CT00_9BACT|nr:DUF1592 domain-containing protein [Opitutaceae bacterium LMO-M01]WED67522.1 DUF1592 domain-containing protein [Opitutaceae bacterium LMO-M01]
MLRSLHVPLFAAFATTAAMADTDTLLLDRDLTPLLEQYCYDCHAAGEEEGGLALDIYTTADAIKTDRDRWEVVLRYVSHREMPPPDRRNQPSDEERDLIARYIEQELYQLDPNHPDPGHVVLRRLNRAEYQATIRDLIGVEFNATAEFPPDDSGYGFDNVGDVLSLPPVLLEKYLAAADQILDTAISTDPIRSQVRRIPASLAQIGFNALGDRGDGWVHLISLEEDDAAVELTLPAGDYQFRVHAYATRDGGALKGQGSDTPLVFESDPGPTKLALLLDDTFVTDFTVTTDADHPAVYEARLGVPAGQHRFRAAVARQRGGEDNETFMLNGRVGHQQPGVVYLKWLEIEGPLAAATQRTAAADLSTTGDPIVTQQGDQLLRANGSVTTTFDLPRETEVILRAQAFAQQAGDEPARMQFRIGDETIQEFDVLAPARHEPLPRQRVFSTALLVPRPQIYEHTIRLPAGPHTFTAAFVNDFTDPAAANPNLRDRNLIVRSLEVSPLGQPVLTPAKPAPLAALFAHPDADPTSHDPRAAARAIVAPFTRRAWRRPVTRAETDRLLQLYDLARHQGESFDAGVKLALKGALVSPHFLLLGGAEVTPADATSDDAVQPLDEFALASRLSYFLWSSMPDDELLNLAEHQQLRDQLPAQVRRMLASPKARALVENFAGQWLQIRSLETFSPDRKLFPEYDPVLRAAMQRETELFFEHVMREDRSVFDFLTADYTFVNARLAQFYGLPALTGDQFQKVSLADTPRRGVLTHASVLTLTSNPTRTSPVKRGKWVLENLLGTPPPPPPPDIPELDEPGRALTGTLREQLEQHRDSPTCASCHNRMDPIGFGLENFDAIGAWRDFDGDQPVDASGSLGRRARFESAAELVTLLAEHRRAEFLRCMADRLLTYALGRGTAYYDRPAINEIVSQVEAGEDRFSALVLAIAESFPFQMRRVVTAPPAPDVAAPAVVFTP